jgi:hypothetical protein
MPQFGGKNAKKTSSTTKRHFTVVMGGKEHGLYVSSTPSSAARKAVTKLCAANKSKKVVFHIREITQDSKKKTYGPYEGYIEKLKEPIELKGRVIKYKPVAKLSGKSGAKSAVKKGGMRGGGGKVMVLKIEKPDNDFNKLSKDDSFTRVLEKFNPPGIYMQPQLDKDTNGKHKFMGLCKSTSYSQDNTVPETARDSIRQLQFLLFKHEYNDAYFRIFISNDNRPYIAIESNKENTYYPLTYDKLTDIERRIYDKYKSTPKDPNAPIPRPMGFPHQAWL